MSTRRRDRAAANRHAHHQQRLAAATTDRGRLRAALDWLTALAIRAGREVDVTRAVLGLVRTLRDGQPLPPRPLPPAGAPLPQTSPTREERAGAREASSHSPAPRRDTEVGGR